MSLTHPGEWRQSDVSRWEACPLSLLLGMQSVRWQPSDAAAIGTLAHRWRHELMGWMRANGERQAPIEVGMELLQTVAAQRDVPEDEVVHISALGLEFLRIVCTKFCYEHTYNVERVVLDEQRLHADIEVIGPDDTRYVRRLTGKPDLVLAGPREDECTVVDTKFGRAKPSRAREVADGEIRADRLSDHGIIQQLVYSLLLFENYPILKRVTLREFYVLHGEAREASYERWQMERIRDTVAILLANMDAAVEAGEESRRWIATPGTHCAMCPTPRRCPLRYEVGIPATYEEAQQVVGEWHVAAQVRADRRPMVHAAVERYFEVELPHSKGRRVVGYEPGTKRLAIYDPTESTPELDGEWLEAAAREAGVLSDE